MGITFPAGRPSLWGTAGDHDSRIRALEAATPSDPGSDVAWANVGAGCTATLFHLQLGGPGYDVEKIDEESGAVTSTGPAMSGAIGDNPSLRAACYLASSPTVAWVAYQAEPSGGSGLAKMVRTTGVIAAVGPAAFTGDEPLDALAWIGDVLYGARGGAVDSDLYTIDPDTGAATSVGPIGYAVTGLVYDAGVLYGVTSHDDLTDPDSLITIAPTGAGTLIGPLGAAVAFGVSDLAASRGNLYGWDADVGGLVVIDKETGTASVVAALVSDYGGGLYFVGSSSAGSGTLTVLELGACLNVTDLGGGRVLVEGCCTPPLNLAGEWLEGNGVVINDGEVGALTWDTTIGPDTLMDLTLPGNPLFIRPGLYATTVTCLAADLTAGGGFDLRLRYSSISGTFTQDASFMRAANTIWAYGNLTLVGEVDIGGRVEATVYNRDGAVARSFVISRAWVQRIG